MATGEHSPLTRDSDFAGASDYSVSVNSKATATVSGFSQNAKNILQQLYKTEIQRTWKVTVAMTVVAVLVNVCFFIGLIVLIRAKSDDQNSYFQDCSLDVYNYNLTMKNTELFEHYATKANTSINTCLDACYNNDSCVAITYCTGCTPDRESYHLCYLFDEEPSTGKSKFAVKQSVWESVVAISRIKEEIIFIDTGINGVERPLRTCVTTLRQCFAACLMDFCCIAFTFSPYKDNQCKLYSVKNLTLYSEPETKAHFVSRHRNV